jgi:LuxR family transcriptional regulator, quorum-sensing system regulator BjaR1
MAGHKSLEQLTFDFIDEIESVETGSALLKVLSDGLAKFGFTSFLISGLPEPRSDFKTHTILNGWPAEWYERYMSYGYYAEDAVAKRARETVDPFLWSEAANGVRKGGMADRIMSEAKEAQLDDGFVVPIYGLNGDQYGVTMAGRNFDKREKSKSSLQMMSMYAHHRLCALNEAQEAELRRKRRIIRLSMREQECLRWVAAGKSDWDIGEILRISSRTVEIHVHNARVKLGAVNRTQAVVEAMRGRHIAL